MPFVKSRYPKDWSAISRRIRFERAQGRCEQCGAVNGQPHPITGAKVVLTVAHLDDSNPMNVDDSNLAALCQRCHNRLDMPMRQAHARATRTQRRLTAAQAAGQSMLMEGEMA